MKCSPKIALLLFAVFCNSSGCSKSKPATNLTAHVDGSVFVVTEGRENMKLGLVNVLVFTQEEFATIIRSSEQPIRQARTEIESQNAPTREKIESLIRSGREADEAAARFLASAHTYRKSVEQLNAQNRLKEAARAQESCDLFVKLSEERKEASLALRMDKLKISLDLKHLEESDRCELIFADLPSPLYSALTDADGKFTFDLPATNKYVVMAKSQRKTLAPSPERYLWAIRLEVMPGEKRQLLLSNHNMVSSLSPESAIQVNSLDSEK